MAKVRKTSGETVTHRCSTCKTTSQFPAGTERSAIACPVCTGQAPADPVLSKTDVRTLHKAVGDVATAKEDRG